MSTDDIFDLPRETLFILGICTKMYATFLLFLSMNINDCKDDVQVINYWAYKQSLFLLLWKHYRSGSLMLMIKLLGKAHFG